MYIWNVCIQWKVDRSLYSVLCSCTCCAVYTVHHREIEGERKRSNEHIPWVLMCLYTAYLTNYHYRFNNCYCCSSFSSVFFSRSYSCVLCLHLYEPIVSFSFALLLCVCVGCCCCRHRRIVAILFSISFTRTLQKDM